MEPKDTKREGDDGQPKQKRLKQASLFSMFSSAPVAQIEKNCNFDSVRNKRGINDYVS